MTSKPKPLKPVVVNLSGGGQGEKVKNAKLKFIVAFAIICLLKYSKFKRRC